MADRPEVQPANYRLPPVRNLSQPTDGGGSMGPSISIGGVGPNRMPSSVQPAGSGAPGPSARGGVGFRLGARFAEGGSADMAQDKALIKKAFRQHDAQEHKGGKGTKLKLAKGGSASKRGDGCATKGKTKGRFV